jgi:hypothetical protein
MLMGPRLTAQCAHVLAVSDKKKTYVQVNFAMSNMVISKFWFSWTNLSAFHLNWFHSFFLEIWYLKIYECLAIAFQSQR